MEKDETFAGPTGHSALANLQTRAGDILIQAREALLNKVARVRPGLVINGCGPAADMVVPDNLGARLKQTLLDLQVSMMDETGTRVDYAALRRSKAYAEYQSGCLAVLRAYRPENLTSDQARRAFWINLYNALVIDAVISFDIKRSVTEGRLGLLAFFRRAAYSIGGQRVSLEDIEHGILRANRGHPFLPGAHFPSTDARLAWALPLDPRIHFALNCGGRSCPPIRAYSAGQLDDQLDLATRGFITATVEIQPETKTLALSRIFQWYRVDFGDRKGLLDFLYRYLPDDERRQFLVENRDQVRLHFADYDWTLNGI